MTLTIYSAQVVLVFLYACASSGNVVKFSPTEKTFSILEGYSLSLECLHDSNTLVDIYTDQEDIVINGTMVDGMSDKFGFQCNETICTLRIPKVTRDHANRYTCQFPPSYLRINVLYSPKQDPVCSPTDQMPILFVEWFQKPVNFTCLSENGYPAIKMKLYIQYANRSIEYLNSKIIANDNFVSGSHLKMISSSSDDVQFFCNISQSLPVPYKSLSYRKSCFIRPVFLSPATAYPQTSTSGSSETEQAQIFVVLAFYVIGFSW